MDMTKSLNASAQRIHTPCHHSIFRGVCTRDKRALALTADTAMQNANSSSALRPRHQMTRVCERWRRTCESSLWPAGVP